MNTLQEDIDGLLGTGTPKVNKTNHRSVMTRMNADKKNILEYDIVSKYPNNTRCLKIQFTSANSFLNASIVLSIGGIYTSTLTLSINKNDDNVDVECYCGISKNYSKVYLRKESSSVFYLDVFTVLNAYIEISSIYSSNCTLSIDTTNIGLTTPSGESEIAIDRIALQSELSFSANKQIHIKLDGTGDFQDVQFAIDSIKDASKLNQYDIILHDDIYINDVNNLTTRFDGHKYYFATKDYVNVMSSGGNRQIFVDMPNNISSANIQKVQCVWHSGESTIKGLDLIVKNGRYALHTEGSGVSDKFRTQKLIDCNFEHKGNEHADNFASWESDMAWGFGNSDGQQTFVENCNFKARKQAVTYHTNINYTTPTLLRFVNCNFVSRTLTDRISISASDLGSNQINNIEFFGCRMNGEVTLGHQWYLNSGNRHSVDSTNFKSNGYGNSVVKKLADASIMALVLTTKWFDAEIKVTGGTAKPLIYGRDFINKTGRSDLHAVCVGSEFVSWEYTESYIADYSHTLAYKLGDCSVTPKTLIFSVNGNSVTITFNKKYAEADPSIPPLVNWSVIYADIMAEVGSWIDISIGYPYQPIQFSDMVADVINESLTTSIMKGSNVAKGNADGFVKIAGVGDEVIGIAIEDIPCQSDNRVDTARIILKGKYL